MKKIWIASGDTDHGLARLAAQARKKGAVVLSVDRRKLDQMSLTHAHQGIIAQTAAHAYASVEDMLALAESRASLRFVICDELSDPHNLGAILRSAECAGAHGVIIPKRRSAGLTPSWRKPRRARWSISRWPGSQTSPRFAGASVRGVWVYGTAADGDRELYDADLQGPAAIVIGNEGTGMGRLVRQSCDVLVRIPMRGRISSLNASRCSSGFII